MTLLRAFLCCQSALLLPLSRAQQSNYGPFAGCDEVTFYDAADLSDREVLHQLIKNNHKKRVPYTSTSPDTWDALSTLDGDGAGNVNLIYAGIAVPASSNSYGVWNREHAWPKSLGVGYNENNKDYTDLHMLRPADASVNSARSNLYYGACGTAQPFENCNIPAHPEAAFDTEMDGVSFLPPTNKRGDLARSMFYMAMRYDGEDGDDSDFADLELSDCPDTDGPNKMGYLSQLLQWHEDDPVDADELDRNGNVCSDWQGNRNPFVDYPYLVAIHFGFPRALLGEGLGYDCSIHSAGPVAVPTQSPTLKLVPTQAPELTTPTPTTSSPVEVTGGPCGGMIAGSVVVVGFKSDNNAASLDEVVLAAMEDLPAGSELYMTDNAWTGSVFKTNEGTLKLTIPVGGISAGSIFGYGSTSLAQSGSWQSASSGSFALSTSGDSISLYCLDVVTSEPRHIFALSSSGSWSAESADGSSFSNKKTARPSTLPSNCALSLAHLDNYRYGGIRSGTRYDLLNAVSDSNQWTGSNNGSSFDVIGSNVDFSLTSGYI